MKKDENLEILSMAGGCNTYHCEGVRKHDCGNPEKIIGNPTKQTGLPRSLSFARNDSKAAFTLAETLITLTILGVIAAITVPMLINKQIEAANRTKVKKAMAVYEKAFNQMIIDYDIKSSSALANEFPVDYDCTKFAKYFKITEGSGCRFKTSDGVWWDISSISKPIIILDKNYKDADWSDLRDGYAETWEEENGKMAYVFGMTSTIDNKGILRINDKAFVDSELNQPNDQKCLAKLYSFINNTEDLDLKYSKPCPNQCDVVATLSGGSSGCSGCSFEFNYGGNDIDIMFDNNGNLYKATYSDIFYDEPDLGDGFDSVRKHTINADLSETVTAYYPTGEKYYDSSCSRIDINTMECEDNANTENTGYYKNGKLRWVFKSNSETHCYKWYSDNGSLVSQNGDGCED